MPEEDWAEVVQGLPAKDEPFIKKYEAGRAALIAQEAHQRSGTYKTFPVFYNGCLPMYQIMVFGSPSLLLPRKHAR